ncbi:hypothetical protein [Spirosoma validum]|uniref:Uncharacterized protein n=1 Tax=Spirosoma validum TaxID=2771355 RepID=A0A927B8D4_9BACT|nr:hypothetical protein [Spirosoma validum]MBD2757611.1 hypothetical protein [Spirosoma validum]
METEAHSSKTNKVLLILGLLLLAVGGVYYWSQSRQPDGATSTQAKPKTDSSQTDKTQLNEQLDALRSQLADAKQENASLTDQLNGLNDLLARAYDRLSVLEGTRIDRMFPTLPETNNIDQRPLHDSLSNQLALMRGKVDQLREVSQQNRELQQALNQRDAKLKTMVSTSAVTGDAFQVSLLKSNQKVTAKAKKVDALNLSFTVPAERHLEGTKDVYLSLVHESGRSPARPLPLATITLPSGNLMIPVDAIQTVTFNGTKQQINFRFHPTVALEPGTYRASVYTNDAYLGSVAVQLRDSFWFF